MADGGTGGLAVRPTASEGSKVASRYVYGIPLGTLAQRAVRRKAQTSVINAWGDPRQRGLGNAHRWGLGDKEHLTKATLYFLLATRYLLYAKRYPCGTCYSLLVQTFYGTSLLLFTTRNFFA